MRKKVLSLVFSSVLFLGGVSVATQSADAQSAVIAQEGDQKKVILTGCYRNGELTGYSNNCGSGSGSCVDRTCN